MKSKTVLLLALVMGIVTTVLFFQYIKKFDSATVSTKSTIEVVAAAKQIEKNERITKDKLHLIEMEEKSVHPEAIKSMDEVIGKLATAVIAKDEPILTHRLISEKEEITYVSRKVKEGFRAVSIGVNINQSVTNLIEPEDEVDVVLTKTKKEGQNEPIVKSEFILKKIRVLAVGRKMVTPEDSVEPYVEYSSVTLELSPTDALTLIRSSEEGNMHLILHQRPVLKENEQLKADQG